jgi:hypothetical protein
LVGITNFAQREIYILSYVEEDIDNLVSMCAKSVYSVEIEEKGTKSDQQAKVKAGFPFSYRVH